MNNETELRIRLPYNFIPRGYQKKFWNAMDDGLKRACLVWHRRSGKDMTAINYMIAQSFKRIGTYFYFFPELTQGRKVIWSGLDYDGNHFLLHHIPKELIARKLEKDMQIILKNGSIFQIVGADNYNRVMGTNAVGMVFSEYSIQDPRAWDHFRPILAENNGWAIFLFTPRGQNHGFELYDKSSTRPHRWYSELLTVENTFRDDGTPVISDEQIQDEIEDGMSEDMVQQEFYCSFHGNIEGSYYGKLLSALKSKGQITSVPHDGATGVYTFWDIGVSDSTAIWFVQFVGQETHLIDYHENVGFGIEHYLGILQEKAFEEGYNYVEHFAPHDFAAVEFGTGKSPEEIAKELGYDFNVVERSRNINIGIQAVRSTLPKCWIDEVKCKRGIECLDNYSKTWNEKVKVFSDKPSRTWANHGADALRTMAEGFNAPSSGRKMTAEMVQNLHKMYKKKIYY